MDFTVAMHLAPGPETVKDYASDAVKNFARMNKVNLDYSVESLKHLDQLLNEWREQGAPISAINKSLFAMGSYAGEVLLKQRNGVWIVPAEDISAGLIAKLLCIRLENGLIWHPIYNGFLIMMGGAEHNFYDSIQPFLQN